MFSVAELLFYGVTLVSSLFLLLICCLRLFIVWTNQKCHSQVSLVGKTAIVTGSSAGIGKEAAADFARRGARVILACRNRTKAQSVADEIVASTGNENVVVKILDSSSLESVREFADQVLRTEKRLDILALNAGIGGFNDRRLSADGIELTMATNHFGHFLLVNLLSKLLQKCTPSRIVVTTSNTHCLVSNINPQDLSFEKQSYTPFKGYTESKLCNVFITKYLAAHFKHRGITVNCFCPGYVWTEIFDKSGQNIFVRGFKLFLPLISKSPQEGSQTMIYLAVSEEVSQITGEYFFGCKVSQHSSLANDEGLVRKVWEQSENIVALQPHESLT